MAKMEFVLWGCDVFTAEVDDHGIDFDVRTRQGRYCNVQVKRSGLAADLACVVMQKQKFKIDPALLLALVQFTPGQAPAMYRIDFLEKFQKMIDQYNAGSSNVEAFFARLMAFTTKLNAEEKRGLAEQLTEEELVIFDLLTKPEISLTKQETAEVKKVAKSPLAKLKQGKLVLEWRKQQTTRAVVFATIQEILDELPRTYTKELYEQKCDALYQHFYEAYMGQGNNVYAVN
jgi:hypothetical protein